MPPLVLNDKVVVSVTFFIAVFNPLAGLLGCPGTSIHCYPGFSINQFAELDKFVSSKAVTLLRPPRQFKESGTFIFWPDAIHPMIARSKVAAGPPQHRDLYSPAGLNHIFSEPMLV